MSRIQPQEKAREKQRVKGNIHKNCGLLRSEPKFVSKMTSMNRILVYTNPECLKTVSLKIWWFTLWIYITYSLSKIMEHQPTRCFASSTPHCSPLARSRCLPCRALPLHGRCASSSKPTAEKGEPSECLQNVISLNTQGNPQKEKKHSNNR